jgi:hypothetical protein
MLEFQRWLMEQDEDGDYPVLNPANVARRWYGKMPAPGAQNEKAIWKFVAEMSDETLNYDFLQIIRRKIRGVSETRYDEPIEGNLLNTRTGKLKNAIGTIFWPGESNFGFFDTGSKAGELEIKHPPTLFAKQDRELLASIIWHELRHAQDWSRGDVHYPPKPQKFNTGKYARHILEARAYADQLQWLLGRVKNVQEVMDMLSSGSEFSLDESLHEVALQFLGMIGGGTNESIASWAAPMVTAAATMFPQGSPATPQQPAAITREAENPAKEVAVILGKFIKLLLFRNFFAT